jgi:hypothetical protein
VLAMVEMQRMQRERSGRPCGAAGAGCWHGGGGRPCSSCRATCLRPGQRCERAVRPARW